MFEAGCEECKLATTTVIVHAGWSKRSNRHSYNAKSGVAVIIGFYTQKILHIGVHNKYCTACAGRIKDQTCYRNWDSLAIETDIFVDDFCQAE